MSESTMMSRMNEFALKYEIGEEGKEEMLKILNESLSVISSEILKSVKVTKVEKKEKSEKLEGIKRYKSRKAEEYAEEHGIDMSEFEMLEISKKDVENLIRSKTKEETRNEKVVEKEKKEEKKEIIKKERVICSGINKKGECCKSTGTINPNGANKKYCFRHAEDWKSFECESDSSESEKEEEEEELKEEEIN
jgi:hypothetical protein